MNKNNRQVEEDYFLLNESDCPVIKQANKKSGSSYKYEKPVLICYGDVRDITLGPSPGFGESGAGVFIFQP